MGTYSRSFRSFGAWLVIGASYALAFIGILSIGIFVFPMALIGTVLLARRKSSLQGLPGFISGIGFPPLYVAYLNGSGPGMVCIRSAGGTELNYTQEFNPWLWLVIGLLLIAGGIAVFLVQPRHAN